MENLIDQNPLEMSASNKRLDPTYQFPLSVLTRKVIRVFVEVALSNPNGDPDNQGAPRVLTDGIGVISFEHIKRMLRDYVATVYQAKLFVARDSDLRATLDAYLPVEYQGQKGPAQKAPAEVNKTATQTACRDFMDVRLFGGVLAHLKQGVRGAFQVTDAESLHEVEIVNKTITRVAGELDDNGKMTSNMGSRSVVRYGLYSFDVFFNPSDALATGLTEKDLEILYEALIESWDLDKSSTRPRVNLRRVVVFDYASARGNAPSHVVLNRVQVNSRTPVPSKFEDYTITVNTDNLPAGMTVHQWVDGVCSVSSASGEVAYEVSEALEDTLTPS